MAKDAGNSLKKKSREDLLLIIRNLVEENETLRAQMEKALLTGDSESAPEKIAPAPESPQTQLMISLDSLRNSVDACTEAILALNKARAENE